MMNPILQGILLGTGQAGSALANARKEAEDKAGRDKQLGFQERQVALAERAAADERTGRVSMARAAAAHPDLAPHASFLENKGGIDVVKMLADLDAKRRDRADEAAERAGVSGVIDKARGTPDTIQRGGALDLNANPEAAGTNAMVPGQAPMTMDQVRSALAKYKIGPAIFKDMYPQDKYASSPQGIFHTGTGAVTSPNTPAPEPPAREGYQRVYEQNARGETTYKDQPVHDRNDFDRAALNITSGRVQQYEKLTPLERQKADEWVNTRPWRQSRVSNEQSMRDLPLTPKQAENFIHPKTMAGPPQGMTMNQAITQGYLETDAKDRQALVELTGTKTLAGTLLGMADKLITATSPMQAAAQAASLEVGARTGQNATARSYNETKEAFLGTLSRTLAAEKGVLTNADILRVARAFPSFFDTVQVKDTKKRLLTALIDTATDATTSKMTKQPINDAAVREKVENILKQLEGGAEAVTLGDPAGFGNTTATPQAAPKSAPVATKRFNPATGKIEPVR